MNYQKITLSASVIAFVSALVFGGTAAFFSDEEVSEGNVFAAGAIDLGIDNESYYNGQPNDGTSWELSFDLDVCQIENPDFDPNADENDEGLDDQEFLPCLFFNFDDVKPGDYGEDTISIHVTNNEAWLCADVKLTEDDDVDCTEPENDTDAENGACDDPDGDTADGDLAQYIDFLWWADDGDNVLEDDEQLLSPTGNLGQLGVGNTAVVSLADATGNIWDGSGPVLTPDPEDILYIGKAWCIGDISDDPVPQDGSGDQMTPAGDNEGANNVGNGTPGQPSDGGFSCDGSIAGNEAQTDRVMLDVAFRAVQARNNDTFVCDERAEPPQE